MERKESLLDVQLKYSQNLLLDTATWEGSRRWTGSGSSSSSLLQME